MKLLFGEHQMLLYLSFEPYTFSSLLGVARVCVSLSRFFRIEYNAPVRTIPNLRTMRVGLRSFDAAGAAEVAK